MLKSLGIIVGISMPKTKELYINLPKLLNRQTVDLLMLGYVLGYRNKSPIRILQVREAIKEFIEDFEFSEDEFPLDSAVTRFYNIYNDLLNYPDTSFRSKWVKLQKNGTSNTKRTAGAVQ